MYCTWAQRLIENRTPWRYRPATQTPSFWRRWDGISVPYSSSPSGHTLTQWGITGFGTTQYVHNTTYPSGIECALLPLSLVRCHVITRVQTVDGMWRSTWGRGHLIVRQPAVCTKTTKGHFWTFNIGVQGVPHSIQLNKQTNGRVCGWRHPG